MKKLFPFLFVLSIIVSGCIISGSPLEDSVFVFPGNTKTFSIKTFPNNGNIVWTLDGEEVQTGGNTYKYTAADDGIKSHTLVARELNAFGQDTYGWHISNDADTAPSYGNNPHVTSGPGPWFEGWYTRVTDIGGSRSIAVIVASSVLKGEYYTPGQYLPGKVNVLISEGDGAPTLSYTVFPEETMALVDGEPVTENPGLSSPANFEWIAVGLGTITQDIIDITIPGVVDVYIQTENRLPFNTYCPDVGPYGILDYFSLPLYWWVHSLGSDAQYEYTILEDGGSDTVNGIGYAHQEKNWGAGFPIGWVWTQGIAPDNESQFVMSTAEVDFDFFILDSWIASFRSPLVSWDFSFINTNTVIQTQHNGCEGTFYFEITDPTRKLTFDASTPPSSFGSVSTPSEEGGFNPETGAESFSATVEVSAYKNDVLIDQRLFYNAVIEFGTGYYMCQ
jgi:tocopherol cyclase